MSWSVRRQRLPCTFRFMNSVISTCDCIRYRILIIDKMGLCTFVGTIWGLATGIASPFLLSPTLRYQLFQLLHLLPAYSFNPTIGPQVSGNRVDFREETCSSNWIPDFYQQLISPHFCSIKIKLLHQLCSFLCENSTNYKAFHIIIEYFL